MQHRKLLRRLLCLARSALRPIRSQ
jgi:hypothetical protein